MNTYLVTLFLVVNPMRDADLDSPETIALEYEVIAESEHQAISKAKSLNKTGLSVYESLCSLA